MTRDADSEAMRVARGLSDDARYLIQTIPARMLTLPWGGIPGAQELLDCGVMYRVADIPHGRDFTPLGLSVAEAARKMEQGDE